MKLTILPLVAALLVGCTNIDPIEVPVPGGAHILHGNWAGTAEFYNPPTPTRSFPVTVTAKATYVSATEYRVEGTLTFQNRTYALQGTGQGAHGATFRPQWSQVPWPSVSWRADLLLGGEKVGSAYAGSYPHKQVEYWGHLTVDEVTYNLTLTRR